MWIKRSGAEVQHKGLWDSSQTINKARRCATEESAKWENPARITRGVPIQIWLRFVNGLLSFKISERIVAGLPDPLMNH
jgi:hypothetical protein